MEIYLYFQVCIATIDHFGDFDVLDLVVGTAQYHLPIKVQLQTGSPASTAIPATAFTDSSTFTAQYS